ncbi:MAG: HAD family hydrolase [Planctomycetota bacterium]|jgi:HAD superfamily hydrolase (TIGR01509 family)
MDIQQQYDAIIFDMDGVLFDSEDAIIFDMDGVLFDSETLHAEAWELSLADFADMNYDEAFYLEWVGIPDEDLAVYLGENHPQHGDNIFYLENKRGLFRKLVKEKLKAYDGLSGFLEKFYNMVPLAIATSSQRVDMDLMLSVTGLDKFFKASCTHNDVTAHKPDPAPYLFAAEQLGIAPEKCIAIDDSPSGVQSGKNAGMLTLGITSSFTADKLEVSDKIFSGTTECCDWIFNNVNFSGVINASL